MPSLNRAVIAKLENGRRETIATSELMVLAKAMDVTPMTLLFALGEDPEAEVLPASAMPTWEAVRWFYGIPRSYVAHQVTDPDAYSMWDSDDPVALFETHDDYVHIYQNATEMGAKGREGVTPEEEIAAYIAQIREQRSRMRMLGVIPPDPPSGLPCLDDDMRHSSYSETLAEVARWRSTRAGA